MANKTPLEKDIQRAICDYLALKKHFFWRNNNTPIFQFDKDKPRFRSMPKYTMKGRPDIEVIKDGYYIALEVKRKNTKQSPEQKEFEKNCKEAGGEYWVVRSIEDVKELGL